MRALGSARSPPRGATLPGRPGSALRRWRRRRRRAGSAGAARRSRRASSWQPAGRSAGGKRGGVGGKQVLGKICWHNTGRSQDGSQWADPRQAGGSDDNWPHQRSNPYRTTDDRIRSYHMALGGWCSGSPPRLVGVRQRCHGAVDAGIEQQRVRLGPQEGPHLQRQGRGWAPAPGQRYRRSDGRACVARVVRRELQGGAVYQQPAPAQRAAVLSTVVYHMGHAAQRAE